MAEIAKVLSDVATKIKDLEERIRMLAERMVMLNNTFLEQAEKFNNDILFLKQELQSMKDRHGKIEEAIRKIIKESENFARKEELEMLEKYAKIFSPLELVKRDEVEEMIKKAIKG